MVKTLFGHRFFLPLFIFLVTMDLIAGGMDYPFLRHCTKPLILLSLFIYFAINGKGLQKSVYVLMLCALFFSWLGDVFLMYESKDSLYFIVGLVAFLTAHVFYCIVFIKRWNKKTPHLFWFIPIVLGSYGFVLFLQLKPALGQLQLPVTLYVLVILLMAITAYRRKGMVSEMSFRYVFMGALFFIVSDSVLAINKFLFDVPFSHLLIMGTYATAQFLITYGLLSQGSKTAD